MHVFNRLPRFYTSPSHIQWIPINFPLCRPAQEIKLNNDRNDVGKPAHPPAPAPRPAMASLFLIARDHLSVEHARATRAPSCAQPILLALLHSLPLLLPLFPKFPSPLSSLTSSPPPFALLLISPFHPLHHHPPSVPIGLISHTDHFCHSPLMAVLRFETSLITFSRESQRLFGYFHTLLFSQMPGPLESETQLTHLKMKTWLCHFFTLSLSLGHLLLWQLCSLFFFKDR